MQMLHCGSTNWKLMADHNYPQLPQFQNFVLLTKEQHNEFDEFKKFYSEQTKQGFTFQLTPLLKFWNNHRHPPSPTVTIFHKHFVQLSCTEVDALCDWVLHTRDTYFKQKKLYKAITRQRKIISDYRVRVILL